MRKEIDLLPEMTVNELRDTFADVFSYGTNSRNREYLIRKIIWGIQVREWGDISPDARDIARKLADFRLLRIRMPRNEKTGAAIGGAALTNRKKVVMNRDPRLPMPGSIITKEFDDKRVEVHILEKGFEFEGRTYRSLSAIAREITGTNWNGFAFFNLGGER